MQELMLIGDLPPELWLRILFYLSPLDLMKFAKTNKTNLLIATDSILWKSLCQRWFPQFTENLEAEENVNWREVFIKQYRQINKPPFSSARFHYLFLETNEEFFSLAIRPYFQTQTDVPNLWYLLYLAHCAHRNHILAVLFPEIQRLHGEVIASIVCFYNTHAIALLRNLDNHGLNQALRFAVLSGNSILVKVCLQQGELSDRIIYINEHCLLHFAIDYGYLAVTKKLLKRDISKIRSRSGLHTPLAVACMKNYPKIIRLLVQLNVPDISLEFTHSARQGWFSVFKILFNTNSISQKDKDLALFLLLENWSMGSVSDRKKIFIILLAAGVNVNFQDQYHRTPLHWATKISPTMVRRLLELGANVRAHDRPNSKTPLHWAAQYAGAAEINVLLLHGANINSTSRNGRCALHYAVMGKNIEALRYLISQKADATLKDSEGATPLKLAESLQMLPEIKTTIILLLTEYAAIKIYNNPFALFNNRDLPEVRQSQLQANKYSSTQSKRKCVTENIFDDPPLQDFRRLRTF